MKNVVYYSKEYDSFTWINEKTTNLDVLLEKDAVVIKEFVEKDHDKARLMYNQAIKEHIDKIYPQEDVVGKTTKKKSVKKKTKKN